MLLLKSKQKILACIVRNPGIHVNALMKEVGTLRDMKGTLNELERNNLIYSKHTGNLRQTYPRTDSELSLNTYCLVEEEEKNRVEKKQPIIREIEKRIAALRRIFGNDLNSLLLFGSIATGHLTEDSDIDLLIIVNKAKSISVKVINLIRTISTNIGREINEVTMTTAEFSGGLKEEGSFAKQVLQEHIILYGTKEFLKLI